MTHQEQNDLADHCWKRRSELVYKVRLSVLYHLKRERFFDQADKAVSIATAIAATSAAAMLLRQSASVDAWVSLCAAALSLIPLVLNPAAASRKHGQLAAEFRTLLAEIARSGEHWSPSDCDEFAAKAIEMEVSEPATLGALVAHCQNQINLAADGPIVHLRWWQRASMNFISFDAQRLAEQKP